MKKLLKNANIFVDGNFKKVDIEITNEIITKIESNIEANAIDTIYDFKNLYVLPGLIDVHTHLR